MEQMASQQFCFATWNHHSFYATLRCIPVQWVPSCMRWQFLRQPWGSGNVAFGCCMRLFLLIEFLKRPKTWSQAVHVVAPARFCRGWNVVTSIPALVQVPAEAFLFSFWGIMAGQICQVNIITTCCSWWFPVDNGFILLHMVPFFFISMDADCLRERKQCCDSTISWREIKSIKLWNGVIIFYLLMISGLDLLLYPLFSDGTRFSSSRGGKRFLFLRLLWQPASYDHATNRKCQTFNIK